MSHYLSREALGRDGRKRIEMKTPESGRGVLRPRLAARLAGAEGVSRVETVPFKSA